MKIKSILVFCLLGLSFLCASFSVDAQSSIKCPVCGKDNKLNMTLSGKGTDTRLDMKPMGFDENPPWQIPVCPECGFVVYTDSLTDSELAIVKNFIKSSDYVKYREREPNCLLAQLFIKLKKEKLDIAFAFLKASWQTEDKPLFYKEDLTACIKYLDEYLKQAGDVSPAALQYLVLKGELLRLSGSFDEAQKTFHQAYILLSNLNNKNGFDRVLDFEFELLQKKDSAPHAFSEIP